MGLSSVGIVSLVFLLAGNEVIYHRYHSFLSDESEDQFADMLIKNELIQVNRNRLLLMTWHQIL